MKKQSIISKAILTIAIILTTCLSTFAHDFEVNGIYYTIIDFENNKAAVTYKGNPEYGNTHLNYPDEYIGDVVIPSSVTYNNTLYSVTSIGNDAFHACSKVTSVKIPNSVKIIGASAFSGCSSLSSISIGDSVSIIGNNAFCACSNFRSITIPNAVTNIGLEAFLSCTNLEEVNFNAENCTRMGQDALFAFNGCPKLSKLNIGNKVNTIPDRAFCNCTGLTSIIIPNSVTHIGFLAFGYTNISSMNISNSVTSISPQAFNETPWLNNQPDGLIYINDVLYLYKETTPNNTSAAIKEGTVSISPEAFADCTGINSIILPNTVTTIGSYAFVSCKMNSIVLGKSVDVIEEGAFKYAAKLTKIVSLNPIPPTSTHSSSIYVTNYSDATLFVPNDSYEQYYNHEIWGKFNNIQKIELLVSNISLENSSIKIEKGEKSTLNATLTPSNATLTDIIWISENPYIATVNNDGTISGISDGNTKITGYTIDGSGVSISCDVTVGIGGIESVENNDNATEVARYDIHGRKLSKPAKGINIVKMSDGTTHKVFVK